MQKRTYVSCLTCVHVVVSKRLLCCSVVQYPAFCERFLVVSDSFLISSASRAEEWLLRILQHALLRPSAGSDSLVPSREHCMETVALQVPQEARSNRTWRALPTGAGCKSLPGIRNRRTRSGATNERSKKEMRG